MSIRALAKDLYAAVQRQSELRTKLEQAEPKEADLLRGDLRIADREVAMLRRMIDGQKENGRGERLAGFGALR